MGVGFFKNTWFTSDWHIAHKNILHFCEPTRPYDTLEAMYYDLIKKYNNHVGCTDVCYFLGDFFFGGAGIGAGILSQLNGTKILVRGNHDKGHQSSINIGFAAVLDSISIKAGGLTITASHFPLLNIPREDCTRFKGYNGVDNWHGEKKYAKDYHLLQDTGQDIHLHGHLHSPNRGASERWDGKQLDVGVDANNMGPISLNRIIKEYHRSKA